MNHLSTSLTRAQEQVVALLSDGLTTAAAAAKVGIHRNTVTNWRRTSPEFRDALESARQERSLLIRENADALVALSFDTVRNLLQDPSAPAGVRLKAALSIINIASASTGFVSQIPQTPEIPPSAAQSCTTAPPLPPDSCLLTPDSGFPPDSSPEIGFVSPATQTPQIPPTSAQSRTTEPPLPPDSCLLTPDSSFSPTTYIRPTPKIGRNEPCPCKSGRKFKHCCLNKPASPDKAAA